MTQPTRTPHSLDQALASAKAGDLVMIQADTAYTTVRYLQLKLASQSGDKT